MPPPSLYAFRLRRGRNPLVPGSSPGRQGAAGPVPPAALLLLARVVTGRGQAAGGAQVAPADLWVRVISGRRGSSRRHASRPGAGAASLARAAMATWYAVRTRRSRLASSLSTVQVRQLRGSRGGRVLTLLIMLAPVERHRSRRRSSRFITRPVRPEAAPRTRPSGRRRCRGRRSLGARCRAGPAGRIGCRGRRTS